MFTMSAPQPILHEQLATLYSDHFGWLRSWLCKRQRCWHNAEDVAQDTFLKLYGNSVPELTLREPRAYLLTIAKRLLVDRARREKLEVAYLEALHLHYRETHAESPEQAYFMLRLLEQLAEVLESLAEKARQAFLQHYLEGYTHAEIAGNLGVSDRMVRKYLAEALLRISRLEA